MHDSPQGLESSEGVWIWYLNAIKLVIPLGALVLLKKKKKSVFL